MPTYRLTKKVLISKPKRSQDFATVSPEPDQVCVAWAEISPMLGFERVQAEQIHPGSTHNIVIRWPAIEIDSGMIVSTDNATYEVQGITDIDGDAQYLQLVCTKKSQRVGVESTR